MHTPQLSIPGFPETRLKTYVLLISKQFLKGHPNEGKPTNFKEKILDGEKIHTVRSNPLYWIPIITRVQKGLAVLSLRQWAGKPYNSPQIEFAQLSESVGYQSFDIDRNDVVSIDNTHIPVGFNMKHFAKNDGLTYEDFQSWFNLNNSGKAEMTGVVIHFTDFRYSF
ncbi:MAG: hypothetical protein ABJH04_07835 [Cyclobacteriaceae bacterium]